MVPCSICEARAKLLTSLKSSFSQDPYARAVVFSLSSRGEEDCSLKHHTIHLMTTRSYTELYLAAQLCRPPLLEERRSSFKFLMNSSRSCRTCSRPNSIESGVFMAKLASNKLQNHRASKRCDWDPDAGSSVPTFPAEQLNPA